MIRLPFFDDLTPNPVTDKRLAVFSLLLNTAEVLTGLSKIRNKFFKLLRHCCTLIEYKTY